MALATVDDFEKIARTFNGNVTVGAAEGDTLTTAQAEQYLADELALMNFKHTDGGDLSSLAAGDAKTVLVRLQILNVLRSQQSMLNLDEGMVTNLDNEIMRWTNALKKEPNIALVDQQATSIVKTPDIIEYYQDNLPND